MIFIIYVIEMILVSCQINNLHGRPGPNSIWVTTGLGDVFVYDTEIAEVVFTRKVIYSINY